MGLIFGNLGKDNRYRGYRPPEEDEADRRLVSSIVNARARLGAVGIAEPQRRPHFLTRAFDILQRPNYAVAGLARELIRPGARFEPGKEFLAGLTGKTKTTFKDVARTAGVSDNPLFRLRFRLPLTDKQVQISPSPAGLLGFAGDVALDPLTYVTFGGLGAARQVGRLGRLKVGTRAGTVADAVAAKQPAVARQLQQMVRLKDAAESARAARKQLWRKAKKTAKQAGAAAPEIPGAMLRRRMAVERLRQAWKTSQDPRGVKFMGRSMLPGRALEKGLEKTGMLPASRWLGRQPLVAGAREQVARIFDPTYHFRKGVEALAAKGVLKKATGKAYTPDELTRVVRGLFNDYGRRMYLSRKEQEEVLGHITEVFGHLDRGTKGELRDLFEGAWRAKVAPEMAARVDELRSRLTERVTEALAEAGADEAQALRFDHMLYKRSPEYQELFWEYRRTLAEAIGEAADSEALKTAVKNAADIQDGILRRELDEGLLTSAIADYFPHVRDPRIRLSPEAQDKIARRFGRQLADALQGGTPEEQMAKVAKLLNPHARERGLAGTIKEINELAGRELFVEDPALALTIRATRSIEARHAKAFLASVCAKYGKPVSYENLKAAKELFSSGFGAYSVRFGSEGVALKEVGALELEALQRAQKAREALGPKRAARELLFGEEGTTIGFALPREFGEAMQRMASVFWTDEGARSLASLLRGVNMIWRAHATVLRLGYHMRNATGNVWLNYLAGMGPDSIGDYLQAAKIQAAAKTGKSFVVNTPLGKLPVEQLLDIMGKRRVIQSYAGAELGGHGTSVAIARARLKGGTINPLSPEWKPTRWGRALASTVEENARIAHFLHAVRKYGDPDVAAASVKKYLFDYYELSPVERNVLREVFPFYCCDPETEVLSRRGWLTYEDVRVGDDILTLNTSTGNAEWQTVDAVFVAPDYKGPMVSIESRELSALVTPDHKWPVTTQHRNSRRWARRKYLDRAQTLFFLKESQALKTGDIFALTAPYTPPDASPYDDDYVELVGWAVTEGHYRKNRWTVEISQSQAANPEKADRIRQVLDRLGARYHEYNGGIGNRIRYFGISGEWARRLRGDCPDKSLPPEFLLRLTHRQLALLLEVLVLADGSTMYGQPTLCSGDRRQAGMFQLLAALLGKATRLHARDLRTKHGRSTTYYVTVKGRARAKFGNCKTRQVAYSGTIWCPHTVNETFFARRRGTVYFTGNTWSRKNIPLQFERLLHTPGKFAMIPKVKRAIEGTDAPGREELPDWFEERGYVGLPAPPGQGRLFGGIELPAMDLNRIRLDKPGVGVLQELLGMVSPVLRVPVEQAMNQVFFTGRPVERFAGETASAPPVVRALAGWGTRVPGVRNLLRTLGVQQGPQGDVRMSARALHLASTFPTVRDILTLTDPESQRRTLHLFSFLAGVSLFEEEQAKRIAMYDRRDRLTALLRKAESEGIEVPTTQDLQASGMLPERRRRAGGGGLIFRGL